MALGLFGVALVAAATFLLQRKLPHKRMLVVTGVLLGVVLCVMVGQTARTLQGVGWLSITPIDVELPAWLGLWFGVFPAVETLAAQVGAAAFVIGSFFLAERVRHSRGRRRGGAPEVPARTRSVRAADARAGRGPGLRARPSRVPA